MGEQKILWGHGKCQRHYCTRSQAPFRWAAQLMDEGCLLFTVPTAIKTDGGKLTVVQSLRLVPPR